MTNYIYLGYGTTGSDGVAKLDHDANGDPISHSYTGVGAGELDVLASLDNPVVEGSVVSQPITVIDSIFFDDALSDAKASQYVFSQEITASYDSTNGTTLTCEETSGNYWAFTKIGGSTNWRDSGKDYCIEFECDYTSNAGQFYFGGQTVGIYRLNNNQTSGSGTVTIRTDGTTLTPYWNGTAITSQEKTMTNSSGFQIGIYRAGNITFRNLKIYTI